MPREKLSAVQTALLSQLRSFVGDRTKIASLGGEQETQFEQAFASLGYTYVKDRAPRLLDYMVGFQLVDRNDDNTKAVGIFGFRIGRTWLYAPSFFLNGSLKGHELLYLKEQDMFVPMKENWVNYVISKKPHMAGRSVMGDARSLNIQQPDIRSMSVPPYGGKQGSADTTVVYPNVARGGWSLPADGFKELYAAMTHGSLANSFEGSLQKHAGFHAGDLLRRFVRENVDYCKLAMETCEANPGVSHYLHKFYGPDFFKEALEDLKQKMTKSAVLDLPEEMGRTVAEYHFGGGAKAKRRKPVRGTQPLPAAKTAASPVLSDLPTTIFTRKQASAPPAVKIKTKDDLLTTENGPQLKDLTDVEATAVAKDGYLVEDARTGEEVSKAYNTQIEMQLVNPDLTGLYEILEKPGAFVKCLVITNPHSGRGGERFATIVRLEPRNWINTPVSAVFGKPNLSTQEDFASWYKGASGVTTLAEDGVYMAITEGGAGSVPFRVCEKTGDGQYRVSFKDCASLDRPSYLPQMDSTRDFADFASGPEMVTLDDREGRSFRSANNTLQIPKEAKILELRKPPERDEDGYCCNDASSKTPPFQPGNIADLQMQILEKTAHLKLFVDQDEACINNGERITKRACLFSLITQHGLRHSEAMKLVKIAERARLVGGSASFRIAYGPQYPLNKRADMNAEYMGQGPGAPAMMPQSYGSDPAYGGATQHPAESYQPVPELSSGLTDPNTYNPAPQYMPDPMVMQQAQQAGRMGQKEVFDTAMITGLIKSVRQDSLVDRYMGDLLKGLDRLGRILFMFYWHNDEFSDRYGKSDMPELEDSIRNSFEVLGDLVLFLKEKDVEPLMRGHDGDPDVEESASN